jgi:predicted unusual protein kinase regulating ubiquinone biosynthesis (AarF/ABC1/UbiB family)
MKQVFVDGFFHADPHPGNIFVLPDNVICYPDFGMMGRINRQGQENCADLVMSVVRLDEAEAVDALLKLTIHDEQYLDYERRYVKPPSWDTFGNQTQFAACGEMYRMVRGII